MATTVHIGHTRAQTVSGSDGSTPAGLTVTSSDEAIATVAVSGDNVTITGVAAGQAIMTYAADGYQGVGDTVNVLALPTLVVTEGAES
jgi:uncharacterized protein YjdB